MNVIEVGRFVFPRDAVAARRYLEQNLLPIHARSARLKAMLFGPRARGTPAELAEMPFARGHDDWLMGRDYQGEPRLVFLFRSGKLRHVIKVRRRGSGASLEREAGVLAALRPPNAPRVEDYAIDKTHELLVLEPLAGRALDISMQRSLRPRRAHRKHLVAAARWLGNFHRTKEAMHGDFWPRNILFTGAEVSGVVDWEQGMLGGDPWQDVFKLADEFTRWRGARAATAPSLNPYLDAYAKAAGLDKAVVRKKFRAR